MVMTMYVIAQFIYGNETFANIHIPENRLTRKRNETFINHHTKEHMLKFLLHDIRERCSHCEIIIQSLYYDLRTLNNKLLVDGELPSRVLSTYKLFYYCL